MDVKLERELKKAVEYGKAKNCGNCRHFVKSESKCNLFNCSEPRLGVFSTNDEHCCTQHQEPMPWEP